MNTEDNGGIESSLDKDDYDFATLSPIKKANAETDMDSDASDDMSDDLVRNLPMCLLISTCDTSLLDKEIKQKYVQCTQPPK